MRKGLELLAGSRGMSHAAAKPDSATKPTAIPTPSRWYRRRGECASTPLTHWLIGSIRWNKLWLVAARLIACQKVSTFWFRSGPEVEQTIAFCRLLPIPPEGNLGFGGHDRPPKAM